jgi:hypothetical protein
MTKRNGGRTAPISQKERGVWVLRTGAKLRKSTVDRVLRQILKERERIAIGDWKS